LIILDTSVLYAYFRADDPDHHDVVDLLNQGDQLIVSPYVIAELDYLLATRAGQRVEVQMLVDVSSGSFELPIMGAADLLSCAEVISRFAAQNIGVADASLVVLADRYQTNRIATLDHRHFSVLRNKNNERFTILPG
jgi:predicted nucleic acid-binding protein